MPPELSIMNWVSVCHKVGCVHSHTALSNGNGIYKYVVRLKQALKVQVDTWRSVPNARGPYSCNTVFSLPVCTMVSWGIYYDPLTEEENAPAWFTDCFAWFTSTTRKWTVVALQPLSGTSLKDSGEGKSSQWVELQAVHLAVYLAWKKKRPDQTSNRIPSHGIMNEGNYRKLC